MLRNCSLNRVKSKKGNNVYELTFASRDESRRSNQTKHTHKSSFFETKGYNFIIHYICRKNKPTEETDSDLLIEWL